MAAKELRKQLINAYCEQAKELINTSKNRNIYLKCGWVDFVSEELIQYEIVGCYISSDRRVYLVHKDGSEGAEKGKINRLDQITTSIDAIENIINGLRENY